MPPSWLEMSLRDLSKISIEKDISKTSQKHLKSDDFSVTSLRHLKYISKKCLLWNIFKTSEIHISNDVFSVRLTSSRHLKYILKKTSMGPFSEHANSDINTKKIMYKFLFFACFRLFCFFVFHLFSLYESISDGRA